MSEEHVSTGRLPQRPVVEDVLREGFERFRPVVDGAVADYIPALARASPELFGACLANTAGDVLALGDADHPFSVQSVSKPFVFALVCDVIGAEEARARLGVNSTGLPFDSVMAVELNDARTMNPMVNAGAIATTSLVPGATAEEKWSFVRDGLSRFAGHALELDVETYESEAATNLRNRGIAHLIDSYERLAFDPDVATDVYTRQCSLMVTATDLAVMGATVADGGVNPVTGQRVIRAETVRLKAEPFVESAKVVGASSIRIMGRHIYRNATRTLPLALYEEAFIDLETNRALAIVIVILVLNAVLTLGYWGISRRYDLEAA